MLVVDVMRAGDYYRIWLQGLPTMVQWLDSTLNAGARLLYLVRDLDPHAKTRVHMPQLKILNIETKT